MRLINADELVDWLENEAMELAAEHPDDASFALYSACDHIDDMPTVPVAPQWISVEDRLPKTTSRYLCTLRTLSGARYVSSVAYYVTKNEYGTIGWDTFQNVTHWMPFPEPPEVDPTWEELPEEDS